MRCLFEKRQKKSFHGTPWWMDMMSRKIHTPVLIDSCRSLSHFDLDTALLISQRFSINSFIPESFNNNATSQVIRHSKVVYYRKTGVSFSTGERSPCPAFQRIEFAKTNPTRQARFIQLIMNYLIAGGARGIGRGLARRLVPQGCKVSLLDHNHDELSHALRLISETSSDRAKTSQTELACSGLVEGKVCDLRSPSQIQSGVAAADSFFGGRLDVLINNAANTAAVGAKSFEELTLEDWHASVETNLIAPMLLSQACLPKLRRSGGCIVHMSSTRAHQSEPDSEAYAATKAGLIGLTHAMATSLGPIGIRVNSILPGWISVADECRSADEKRQDPGDKREQAGGLSK